jgi:hypothetical protein
MSKPTQFLFTAFRHAKSQLMWRRYRLSKRAARLKRAWLYAFGELSQSQAQDITLDCQAIADWFPLVTLTISGALDLALETYADTPELRSLLASAVGRVANKWEGNGDALLAAESWAVSLVPDYARQLGVTLSEVHADNTSADSGQKSGAAE